MRNAIPLSVPVIDGNEWKYVKECLDTGWVSSVGGYVTSFEKAVARYVGSRYAVATVNGTAALHVSLMACGVRPGDEVIVPALTFIAPVNIVRYCQAEPVFMDCDPETLCMDAGKFIDFIKRETVQKRDGFTYNKTTGRRIRAVIPVHVFGHPAEMEPLVKICCKRKIDIIEDATESLGSEYKKKKTGTIGKVGCFSFNGNKIITTGGGGMVVTNDRKIADRIRHLTTQARSDPVEYDHDEIGYNYRLSNIQAAMGAAQLERLAIHIEIKRRNALIYRKGLSGISEIEFLWERPWAVSNFWLCTIKVAKKHKRRLLYHLLSKGIGARPIWKPVNSLAMYRGCQSYRVEDAPKAYDTCLNIPSSVNLTKAEIERVVETIKGYFKR